MNPEQTESDKGNPSQLRWLILVLIFETVIATGSLLGVAMLNLAWLGGLGTCNALFLMAIGLVPSLILSFVITRQQKWRPITALTCVLVFILSAFISYHLGIAMVGI